MWKLRHIYSKRKEKQRRRRERLSGGIEGEFPYPDIDVVVITYTRNITEFCSALCSFFFSVKLVSRSDAVCGNIAGNYFWIYEERNTRATEGVS
jgi:hypothetical protein